MATYTSIINSILRRLRESTVAAPTSSTYALLIGDLVNETKREVEDAWKWHSLRSTIPVTTANGTAEYAITGAGKRFQLQDKRFSVYDATNKHRLTPQSPSWIKEAAISNSQVQIPSYYYFSGFDSSGDPLVTLYSTPADVYTINFEVVVPQGDFSTGNEVLSVPDWPVILGAYAKAIAERGEDNGKAHGEALNKYGFALSDAIAIDASLSDDSETSWYA